MGLPRPERPRVSRETRLLLATILLSIAVLWALARLRFPDRPVTTNPVPPLLTQLAPPPALDDLSAEIAALESRLLPSLVQTGSAIAMRMRGNAAATYIAPDDPDTGSITLPLRSHDRASGLAIVEVPEATTIPVAPWSPNQLDRSRYLLGTGMSASGVFLRPVFAGHLHPVADLAWQGNIWMLPARTDVSPGDYLFTTDGSLVGLVVIREGGLAVVPGETLLRTVDLLLEGTAAPGAWIGVEVDASPLPALTDSEPAQGVVVAWVDPKGPAQGTLFVLDVIQAIDGTPVASPADWRVRLARLAPQTPIVLQVRREGGIREVPLVTAVPLQLETTLGLKMRTVRSAGVEVLQVLYGSVAARAGIRAGDMITAFGGVQTPTVPQVERAFETSATGRQILVAIARANRHHIIALEK